MAQVSYGTITITDNNDIEKIYMQYAQSQSNQTAPTSSSDWSTDIPTWRQGYYIWQRTVTKMSGVPLSSSSYGNPVCLTGSTGSTGTTGRGVSSIVTTYCNYGTGTPAADYSGWSTTVPAYDSSKPNYWVKTVITYTSGTPATDTTIYKDNGITSANSTAAAANSTAQTASGKADEAWSKADNAQTVAGNASSAISDLNQYFWRKKTASTNVPAGSYVTNIPGTDYQANPASGGYNSLVQADGIYLRNGITTLSSWTGSALTFNNPSNGSKVIELGSISNVPTLSFYNPSNNTIPMMRLSTNALTFGKPSDGQVQLTIGANGALQSGDFSITANTSTFASLGTKIDLTYGEIYTPYFRVSQGSVSGGPAAGVYITGNFESTQANIGGTKPWVIKTFKDSKQINLASITGPNSSFIQLGSSGSWLLHSNKIHTAWYISGNYLEYPLLNEKYYDFGMNLPTSLSDKFLYIRYNTGTNLSSIYQNDTNWVYPFYIDASGNVHAPAYYVGSEPLTGGVGSIAEKIINSDSTYGKGSATQPVYIDSNGRPATTTYALNAAGAKGVVTDLANNTTSTNLPTAAAVVSYVTSRGYITSFTDKNVQTNLASNSSTFYIAGPTSTATTTGTLKVITDAKITVDGNGKATITATNFSGTASRATADSDGNTIKSTYLKLSGGNVTGAVTFGSSVSVDELMAGDLVVNGNASFTNNAQFNTINGVAVGSSPKFTDTTYSSLSAASGGTAVSLVTTGEKYTWNNKQDKLTNPVTGTGTSGYLTKWTGTNTIGNGPALGTDTTKFLNNKGEWAVPAGTYTYTLPLAADGVRGGVQIGYTQSGKNYPVQLSNEKMYVNVPWDNTWTAMTGATSSADGTVGYIGMTPPKSGYNTKYWRADGTWSVPPNDNTHRPIQVDGTEILGNNTTVLNLKKGNCITLSNSSGAVTFDHNTSGVGNAVATAGLYKFKYDTYGHVTGATAVVKADITGLGIPAQDTTYSNASTTTAGLMSAADKKKLDNIQVDSSGQAVAANVAGRWGIDVTFSDTNVAQVGHANSAITASNTQASTVSSATTKTALSFGSIVKLPYVSYDTYGHVTGRSEVYFQLPAAPSSTTNATNDSDGNPINTTYLKKSGGTMTGALNTANGTANKIGDDSQLGDFNVAGTLGIQGLNGATGIALLQQGTTWGSTGNYTKLSYDGTTATLTSPFATQGGLSANSNKNYPFNTDANTFYVNKAVNWNASSYYEWVYLLLPVLTSTNMSALNYIEGTFNFWKTGGNVYDNVKLNLNCCYNCLEYYLDSYGQGTDWKLVTCTYNGVKYYALKGYYHANPYTHVTFSGHVRSDIAGGNNTTTKPLALPYAVAYYNYTSNSANAVVLNSEIYNSLSNTLTDSYVTQVNRRGLSNDGGFIGPLTGTASGNITSVDYDSSNYKFTYTKNGTTSDIITVASMLGFASRNSSATWGNTTGTSVLVLNDSTGGSIDFRRDNPSSGKISMKVDGRFYFNEGATPAAGLKSASGYWGMTGPDGEDNIWIRTTSNGIIPYQGGNAGSGHGTIGTSTWYFSAMYADNFYGNASTATTATNAKRLIQNTEMTYAWDGINYFNISAANQSAAKVNDTPFSSATWTHILRFNHGNTSGYYTDLAVPFNANSIYYKRINAGSLQNSSTNGGWVKLLDQLNYTDYTVTKTGEGASGSWGISVTGSAASITGTLPVSQLTWAGNVNLVTTATANGQEWSIDLTPGSYTGTYWHVWSSKNSKTILSCYPDDNSVRIPSGPLYIGGTTYYINTSGVGNFNYLTLNRVTDHGLQVGTIRGLAVGSQTGQYIHMYDRVHIGSPSGWGSRNAPQYGLSTYGGAWLATDTGNVGIGTTSPGQKLDVNGYANTLGYIMSNKATMKYDATLDAIVFSFA